MKLETHLIRKIDKQLKLLENNTRKTGITILESNKNKIKNKNKMNFSPKNNDKVTVNYKGLLTNGQEFDNSWKKNKPFEFTVGKGEVIKGWDIIIKKMILGEKVKVLIPFNLGYGLKGIGNIIPPRSDLIFYIKLLKINNIENKN